MHVREGPGKETPSKGQASLAPWMPTPSTPASVMRLSLLDGVLSPGTHTQLVAGHMAWDMGATYPKFPGLGASAGQC